MQPLIVQYYNSTILNSATITIAITTSITASSALSKSRKIKLVQHYIVRHQIVQYWNGVISNSATSQSETLI